ncbi:MAG: 2-amino-4-hydroxy-6-hydroxymethyldihydropteridine diphosphokinase [bacterium]|nr:2-amino-4-hydroxy-6-hydroxymethyldihydropteridine diphosphokinase [bacterium]
MTIVYLCLGSNKGDRVGYIQQACSLLGNSEGIKIVRTSSFYETQPWLEKDMPWFVNAVVEIKTTLEAKELLHKTMEIEAILGRDREKEPDGNRTIDIDILFYGNDIVDVEDLQIPHVFLHQRAFVLVPFLEINQDFVHPVLNKTVSDLYEELEEPEQVYLYGTKINDL